MLVVPIILPLIALVSSRAPSPASLPIILVTVVLIAPSFSVSEVHVEMAYTDHAINLILELDVFFSGVAPIRPVKFAFLALICIRWGYLFSNISGKI